LEVARAALQRFDVIMMLDGLDEDSAQVRAPQTAVLPPATTACANVSLTTRHGR
jgi:hypothetical protein|tara:strand:+ start:1167 stop:1328 length:162 start_codon:yes stop_codon:yes gene_type:complete